MSRYTTTGRNQWTNAHKAVRHDARKLGKTNLEPLKRAYIPSCLWVAVPIFAVWIALECGL